MSQTSNYICLSLFVSATSGLRCDFNPPMVNELSLRFVAVAQRVKSPLYIMLITITRAKSSKAIAIGVYHVPILIQNRITVTRCTHNTLLYHLYIMLEKERTKRKSKIIFFLSIQKRGDLSTSCIRDYLSVISPL